MLRIADLIEYMNHGIFAAPPPHTELEFDRGVDDQPWALPVREDALHVCSMRMSRNDMHVKHTLNASHPR